MNTTPHEFNPPKKCTPKQLRVRRVFRGSALFCALTFGAHADPFESELTLQSALEYGATNNPRLQAAFSQWKGAEEIISVQKGFPIRRSPTATTLNPSKPEPDHKISDLA